MSEALKKAQRLDQARRRIVNMICISNPSDVIIRLMLDINFPEEKWEMMQRLWKIRVMVERGHFTMSLS